MNKVTRTLLLAPLILLLSACPQKTEVKPGGNKARLVNALVDARKDAIVQAMTAHPVSAINRDIIALYMLMLDDNLYAISSDSLGFLPRYNGLTSPQKNIVGDILSWAFMQQIYRHETAGQVRILQRQELLLAPSRLQFSECRSHNPNCANDLRKNIRPVLSFDALNTQLMRMAEADPCINMSKENKGAEVANRCLASRKGNLKVTLVRKPNFTRQLWQSLF